MARSDNIYEIPQNIPAPVDDGACDHLPRMAVPAVALLSTAGRMVDLAAATRRQTDRFYPQRQGTGTGHDF